MLAASASPAVGENVTLGTRARTRACFVVVASDMARHRDDVDVYAHASLASVVCLTICHLHVRGFELFGTVLPPWRLD